MILKSDVDQFLGAWAADAVFFKQQPGFISAQLHRGIAGSSLFLNYAGWESAGAFRRASALFASAPASTIEVRCHRRSSSRPRQRRCLPGGISGCLFAPKHVDERFALYATETVHRQQN